MSSTPVASPTSNSSIRELARCLSCATPLSGEPACPQCRRAYPLRDGIMEAIGPLSGRNRIVAAFYDGPGWVKFKPWEDRFLMLQGGARRARTEILRHFTALGGSPLRCLEVGIGDGANLAFLPSQWAIFGVDISRVQLAECLQRHRQLSGRLAWAEAENLPFPNATFDATLSVGGFTYYRDHEAALREMRRVTKPGGPVVVADEVAGLHRAGLGHLLGIPAFDSWWLYKLGLDREFVTMALTFDVDLKALFSRVFPGATRRRIWHSLGYCICDTSM
jgi:SAM-dependent methyltransferase